MGNERSFYVSELASEECACCKQKKSGNAFCWRCYRALPQELQQDLYQRIGHGYEQAYEAAHKYLSEHCWR